MVRQVRFPTPGEAVYDTHPEAASDKKINHVAADEPGAAGDYRNRRLRRRCLH